MLHNQCTGQIRDPDGERRAIDLRDEHAPRLGAKPDMAGRPTADRGTQMSFLNQAQPLQRRETVGDYGAAELGLPFDLKARRRDAVADERQDRGQAPAPAFQGGGTTNAPFPRAGRGPLLNARHRAHRYLEATPAGGKSAGF